MKDRNGVEIKMGDVVLIRDSYFKVDNGYWFAERVPGDPGWCGSDVCLKKISKSGKISKNKGRNIAFWPLIVTVNSWEKRAAAKAWNAEHASIEVVEGIDRSEVKAHFEKEAEIHNGLADHFEKYGFPAEAEKAKKLEGYYAAIADGI